VSFFAWKVGGRTASNLGSFADSRSYENFLMLINPWRAVSKTTKNKKGKAKTLSFLLAGVDATPLANAATPRAGRQAVGP
jgi:hypothetical protein